MVGVFPYLRLIQQACVLFQKFLSSPPSLDTFYMKLYNPKLYILCAQVFFPEPSVNGPVSKAERKWSFLPRIILSSSSWLDSTPPFPRLVLTFHAPVMKADSSDTASNWGTCSSKPFFPGHTLSTDIHLLLADVPGKSALAVLFPVLRLAFAVRLHLLFSFFHEPHGCQTGIPCLYGTSLL